MKTLFTILVILGAQFIAAPNADAQTCSTQSSYVSGRTSCGCPIYTVRYVAYYDSCGHPVFRYKTQPITHRCRPAHNHRPVYRQTYYQQPRHGRTVQPSCGTTRTHGRYSTKRTSFFGFRR